MLLAKTLVPITLAVVLGLTVGIDSILGVSILALITIFGNSNGALWLAFAGQYGDERDRGAYEASVFDEGPFLALIYESDEEVAPHPTWQALHTTDLLMLAGGGIAAYPDGAAAGVKSLRDSWVAAQAGTVLEDAARNAPTPQRLPNPGARRAVRATSLRRSPGSCRDDDATQAPICVAIARHRHTDCDRLQNVVPFGEDSFEDAACTRDASGPILPAGAFKSPLGRLELSTYSLRVKRSAD